MRSTPQYERWLGGCLQAAYNVLNEAEATENHANRLVWANSILTGSEDAVKAKVQAMMKYAIASNVTIQAAPTDCTDNDIAFVVAGQLNILAE
jgi:predicted transcriptional regulator